MFRAVESKPYKENKKPRNTTKCPETFKKTIRSHGRPNSGRHCPTHLLLLSLLNLLPHVSSLDFGNIDLVIIVLGIPFRIATAIDEPFGPDSSDIELAALQDQACFGRRGHSVVRTGDRQSGIADLILRTAGTTAAVFESRTIFGRENERVALSSRSTNSRV